MKNYKNFIKENIDIENIELFNDITNDLDILESIVVDSDDLFDSIDVKKIDLFQTFTLNPDDIDNNISINELYDNNSFNKCLSKLGLSKNRLVSTDEVDTFIDDSITIEYFLVFKDSELKPKYIIFQKKKKNDNKNNIKCYMVKKEYDRDEYLKNDEYIDMIKFDNKLSSKNIEIRKGGKTYLYNKNGEDWQLGPGSEETDTFKKVMSKDKIKAILTDDDVSITILA